MLAARSWSRSGLILVEYRQRLSESRNETESSLDRPELSIVIPCLNESATLGICIRKAQSAVRRLGLKGEVVVADNGSSDGSVEIAKSLGARIIDVKRPGYGSALIAGCRGARGRYVLMGDADDSYDFSAIEGFVDHLRDGNDLVMGTRLKGEILPGAMPWKNRYIGNPVLTRVLRVLFGARISDAHCGMRAFTKQAFDRMDLRSPGMEFASEMVIKAARKRMHIAEVPITFYPDRRERRPHLRPWRDGWRHLKLMLLFSPTALFLIPGLGLITVGVLLFATQLFSPAEEPASVLGFRLDFHWAIVGSFLTLVGYQIVTIHFYARVYSVTHRLREEDRLLRKGFAILTLNRVLIIAALAILAGLAIDAMVVLQWLRSDFGELVPGQTRFFIFGSTLLALGIQTLFNAFFFSILGDAYKYPYVDEGTESAAHSVPK
jgi:glycosyltransferase involved in cell wall biosynthesis